MYKRQIVYGVPSILQVLSSLEQEKVRFDQIMSSGAPLTESLFSRLRERTETLKQQYGCTETGCITLSNQLESQSDIGFPLEHLQLSTSEAEDNPAEIVVSFGEQLIRTNDLGYISPSRSIRLVGRKDDVINVSGFKVYPLEIEELIGQLPEVKEVVVYRGEHPVAGELVKAKIVAEASLTEMKVKEWCSKHLPAYKVPAQVEHVPYIPKTITGKISRKLLEVGERG